MNSRYPATFLLIITATVLTCIGLLAAPRIGLCQTEAEAEPTFEIREFFFDGNHLLHNEILLNRVKDFVGPGKTARDVEAARSAAEKAYHERGYPTALVNIPPQSIEDGVVRLEVIESKIRRVRVKGNRYFTRERLLNEIPALNPGEVFYLPDVKQQLARVNRNLDLKVAPVLMPGRELGTIDVDLHVKDKLPLHGALELNNRSTHDTTDLRLNAMLRYDNLWQKEHSVSLQAQTSPEDTEEVKLFSGSYSLPSPWDDDHLIVLYGLRSDSSTATAENILVVGEGYIVGMRYLANLPPLEGYLHSLVFGLDYKDFKEDIEGEKTPVRYTPLSASYNGTIPDKSGETRFSLGINLALRQLGSNMEKFDDKRWGAQGNYFYGKASLARHQKLWANWRLTAAVDGQLANQPLISNEQYIAGGVSSVRGYMESEAVGDDALHGTTELIAPDLGEAMGAGKYLRMTPYLFYDVAALKTQDALSGEDPNITLQGAGAGVRGHLIKYIDYQVDWGVALEDTDKTDSGDQLVHFKVLFKF